MNPVQLLTWVAVVVASFCMLCVALVVLAATVRSVRDGSTDDDAVIEVEHQA